jgi:pimeloyl-ACP methyl ester carboxylesterase
LEAIVADAFTTGMLGRPLNGDAIDRVRAYLDSAMSRVSSRKIRSSRNARTCLRSRDPRHQDFPLPLIKGRDIMMNRRIFSTALLAGAAASLISTRGMAANATPPKARNVVLVHGLFADGSCWSEVIARLQTAGLNVTSVQNPLTTLPEAVASAERVLARQDGPTVLVGHSFSGMIVTDAGVHPNVSALVYVAARAPDAGEDYTALAKTYPTPPATAGILFDGDEGRLSEEAFLRDFAGDLPETKAKVLYAVQEPFHKALLAGKTAHAAWRSKPSYYAVSTEDRTINPDLERFMAKRMGAKTIEVKASHLSLISRPDEITQLILEAAGQRA